MVVLSLSGIEKSFLAEKIIEDISFNVNSRDKIGLIGANGSGKTTLMNIIYGDLNQDSGEIYKAKDLSMGYLLQNIDLKDNLTVYDTCLKKFEHLIEMEKSIRKLEIEMGEVSSDKELENIMHKYSKLSERFQEENGYGFQSEIKGTLKGLGFEEIDFEKEVSKLSGGQKSRLHLATLLLQKPDILLLDEPTNHLDMDAINFLENFLINFQGTVIMISHDRYFLDKVANKILHLENKKLKVYNTNYTKFVETRKKELEIMKRSYENQQKEIKRQEEIIERFANYGRDRYIKQSQSRRKQLDKLEIIDKPYEAGDAFKLNFSSDLESGNEVAKLENISKSFDGVKILENINIDVFKKDRIGVIGANGIGKSTLIKMIVGEMRPDSGEVIIGSNVVKGYYDQTLENLHDVQVIDEILDSYPDMTIGEARNYLAVFNFQGEEVFKNVMDLSGGERGRLSLLKIMLKRPNFLLMDEPTNHLDIESKEILEDALNKYDDTFLVISHDRYFLNKVANKIVLIEPDNATVYYGNYDYYVQKVEESKIQSDEEGSGLTKTAIVKEKKKASEIKRKKSELLKNIKSIEKEQEELDKKIKVLEEKAFDPEIYNDYEASLKLHRELDELKELKDNLFNEWFELSAILEDYDEWIETLIWRQ